MALKTTVIGAYPKPPYTPVTDWFQSEQGGDDSAPTSRYVAQMDAAGEQAKALFRRAAAEVIADQALAGIDVVTDGEVRRENYIHYHCRHLDGIDFETLTEKVLRNGAYSAALPTITGPVKAGEPFLVEDWQDAQATTERPVKVTLPGPMTIGDTTADAHYEDPARRGRDLADAINAEVRALAAAGCRYIQVDEPLFARKPTEALSFGIENLERCFHGVGDGDGVTRVMHMCCGYPDRLDAVDYPKADPQSYLDLAEAVDASCIDEVSIEDAHRHNDLALLERFRQSRVIFGAVAIAKSRIEPVEEIEERLKAALEHIDEERLIAAPDCGLGYLGRDLAFKKLGNLVAAARSV